MVGQGHHGAVQRAGVFAFLPHILMERGVDPSVVFEGLDVDPTVLRHETMVSIATILAVLDRAATLLNCPHLGLLLGERFSLAIHGPIGQLMATAPTLGQAIIDFVTWQQGYSNSAVVYLNKMGDVTAFGFGAYDRSSPGNVQLYDAVMAVGCKLVAILTQGRVRPLEVFLNHRRPDDIRPYQTLLGVPVRFDQYQSCLILDEGAMRTELPGSNPDQRRIVLQQLQQLSDRMLPRMSEKVAHRLKPLLHTGQSMLNDVAREFNLHPRTLRRRLKADGSTFEEIKDRVRFTLAVELLDMTDLPIGEVGEATQFASHPAFDAAFKRWTGMTPRQWRAKEKMGSSAMG